MARSRTQKNDSSKQPNIMIPIISYVDAEASGRTTRPAPERTLSGTSRGSFLGFTLRRTEVSAPDLQENLKKFLTAMGSVLEGQEEKIGGFHVEELEIEVEVSAEGEVRLFGTGGKIGGKGSLTLRLRRS
jgi:hypothetical protein